MSQSGGYPAESDIDTYLSAVGVELVTENNSNFVQEYKQHVYSILNALRWAMSLGVWCPSTTTFNVRGGSYIYNGTKKTYAPGGAIDPTDNDTTYIWLKADNTIGSGIDGSGWPGVEHIKLAEIDVDSDGVITAIRDKRGETFLQFSDHSDIVCKNNQVVCKDNMVVTKPVRY